MPVATSRERARRVPAHPLPVPPPTVPLATVDSKLATDATLVAYSNWSQWWGLAPSSWSPEAWHTTAQKPVVIVARVSCVHEFQADLRPGETRTFTFSREHDRLGRDRLGLSLERPDSFVALELRIGRRRFVTSEIAADAFASVSIGRRTIVRLTVKNTTKRRGRVRGQWTLRPVGLGTGTDVEREIHRSATRIAGLAPFQALPRAIAMHDGWTGGDVPRGRMIVPDSVRRRAFEMAAQYLSVALAPEADASAVAHLRRVMDFALRRRGPLVRKKDVGNVHEPPVRRIKAAQSALVRIFEGASMLPMNSPFEAVRVILKRLIAECARAPRQFREAEKALRKAKRVGDVGPEATKSRIVKAMAVVGRLYDADRKKGKRIRIALGRAGGRGDKKTVRPWTAARDFAEAFIKGWMPKTRYDASRPKRAKV